jgi:hypothetical protein
MHMSLQNKTQKRDQPMGLALACKSGHTNAERRIRGSGLVRVEGRVRCGWWGAGVGAFAAREGGEICGNYFSAAGATT